MARFVGQLRVRTLVSVMCVVNVLSLALMALSNDLLTKLISVMLASFAMGMGESVFLTMAGDQRKIMGWSSGTGASGLIGSAIFFIMTSVLAIPPWRLYTGCLLLLPLIMWLSFNRIDCTAVSIQKYSTLKSNQQSPLIPLFTSLFLIYFAYSVSSAYRLIIRTM